MQLSKDFNLSEFTRSKTAIKKDIDNMPNPKEQKAIQHLVDTVLQPVRSQIGMVISVTSGFRSKELNEIIGGANGSQHTKGEAADLECNDNARLFNHIRANCQFDQLIWEFGDTNQPDWVHVSVVDGKNRREVLRAVKIKGKTAYQKF